MSNNEGQRKPLQTRSILFKGMNAVQKMNRERFESLNIGDLSAYICAI
jgi:hypothetical protein